MAKPTKVSWRNAASVRRHGSGVAASVLVPARYEGYDLLRSLPAIGAAAQRLATELVAPVEVLLLAETSDTVTLSVAKEYGAPWGVRTIPIGGFGKFHALRAGVQHAASDLLVLVDADILPPPAAFEQLCRPLITGDADVSLSRPTTLPLLYQPTASEAVVWRWDDLSCRAWDLLRRRHKSHLWAISGQLFALRRELFPDRALVPLIDDASIGIYALERGARLYYEPDAAIPHAPPSNYWLWCRQKFRTRQGWAALQRLRPLLVDDLTNKLAACLREVLDSGKLSDRVLPWHDRQLRRLGRYAVRSSRVRTGVWTPPRRSIAHPSMHRKPAMHKPGPTV